MTDEEFENRSYEIYNALNDCTVRDSIGILENVKLAIFESNRNNNK